MVPALTATQEKAVNDARAFAAEYFSEDNIKAWCKEQGMPAAVLKAYHASDLGRLGLPKSLDGIPCDLMTQVLVIEELHRASATSLPLLPQILSMSLMQSLGGDIHYDLIKRMQETTGEIGFSEAITESISGTDTFALQTSVSKEDDGLYLSGSKMFVTNGQFAPYILTIAREPDSTVAEQKLTFWLFSRNLKGVSTFPIEAIGQKMTPLAAIDFDHVKMEPEYAVGERGQAFAVMMKEFDIGRVLLCASNLGLAKAAMDDAVRYAVKRDAFGGKIASFPQIQEKLVEMEIGIRNIQASVYGAAQELDQGMDIRLSAALMKRMVPRTATEVASQALQIFGGLGYTELTRVGRIWQDCRGCQIAQGTDEIMVKIAGKRIINNYL